MPPWGPKPDTRTPIKAGQASPQTWATPPPTAPAYRLGLTGRTRYDDWDSAEPMLGSEWESAKAGSTLSWDKAKPASRAAWDRVDALKRGTDTSYVFSLKGISAALDSIATCK